MCLLIVWLSEGKGHFIVVEGDPKCISIKSMHKHSITYIWNCIWVPSSLLLSCTCLPSCEQRGYSSQIQRKILFYMLSQHQAWRLCSLHFVICLSRKATHGLAEIILKLEMSTHTHAPTNRNTRHSFTGLNVWVYRLMLDERGGAECTSVSLLCPPTQCAMWGADAERLVYFRPWICELFSSSCSLQDQSDSSTLVLNMTPAGNKARLLQKSDPQVEAAVVSDVQISELTLESTVVNHVQISWLALKDRH